MRNPTWQDWQDFFGGRNPSSQDLVNFNLRLLGHHSPSGQDILDLRKKTGINWEMKHFYPKPIGPIVKGCGGDEF